VKNVVFCYWRPNNTIILYNWTYVDNNNNNTQFVERRGAIALEALAETGRAN